MTLQKYNESICVILPALNEEKNLEWLLPLIKDKYRSVVVDNGSTDGTVAMVKSMDCEILSCPQKGYGRAILKGIKHISNNSKVMPSIIVVCDADGTSPVDAIFPMIESIEDQKADIVIGQRIFKESRAMPIHASFGNRLTVRLIEMATGFRYSDMGPLRAIRFSSLEKLAMEDQTWGWNVEMQMKAVWEGLRIEEQNIHYNRRRYGESKISGTFWGTVRAGSKILMRIAYFYLQHIFQIKRRSLAILKL